MPFYFICLTFYNWCFHYGCPIMLPAFVLCIIPFPATGQILKTLACYWIFSWNHMFLYVFNLVQTDALSLIICSTEIGVSVSLSYRTSLVTHHSFFFFGYVFHGWLHGNDWALVQLKFNLFFTSLENKEALFYIILFVSIRYMYMPWMGSGIILMIHQHLVMT